MKMNANRGLVITRNRVVVGMGSWCGVGIECDADLGDEIYDAIEARIRESLADDDVAGAMLIDGVRWGWYVDATDVDAVDAE